MARTFLNPQKTFNETVGASVPILVFLLGPIGLLILALYKHAVIWLFTVFLAAMIHPGIALVIHLIFYIVYVLYASTLKADKFLREGWTEVLDGVAPEIEPQYAPMSETKKCPFCAEEIRFEAIKCKHCGSDLKKPVNAEKPKFESDTDKMKRLGITFSNGKYIFKEYSCDILDDAISYASMASKPE